MVVKNISVAVIKRLPRYYKTIKELEGANITRVSSEELAGKLSFTASKIRQDLNCFGGFGQQGYGYNVSYLCNELEEILGINKNIPAILIGTGNMGTALLNNFDFAYSGFNLVAGFDININNDNINNIPIFSMDKLETFIEKNKPKMAVLTIPRHQVQKYVSILIKYEIRGIWNFTNEYIQNPDIVVENVNFSDSLMTLCYNIKEKKVEKID